MELSKLILVSLVQNQTFTKKVIPHIKKEYFPDFEQSYLFSHIKKYLQKYRSFPSESSLKIELQDARDLNEKIYSNVLELTDYIYHVDIDYTDEWIVSKTEEWCKERAIYNALLKSIELHEERKSLEGIPEILRNALQITFDNSCGLEIFDEKSIVDRIKNYKKTIKKFPTGITKVDIVTDGGFEAKAVSIFFGASGAGKSATLVSISANMCRNGEDVLYVTLEMAEEKISQRYEANFLDEKINNIKNLDDDSFRKALLDIKGTNVGRVIVREYPTATINVEHIRSLIDELELKKNFKPTVLVIDYINLMRSCRFSGDNMYSTVKSITEEIRGLAIEKELCVITATQANKDGNNSKLVDLDMTNVGESKGIVDTCDFLAGMIYSEELREKNIQIWKVLKNRFGGTVNYKIPIGVDHSKSMVFDDDYSGMVDDSNIVTQPLKQSKPNINITFKEEALDDDLWDG